MSNRAVARPPQRLPVASAERDLEATRRPRIDVAARNLIFLIIMPNEKDPDTAAEAMFHVWYSASVTESCYTLLQKKLKPMIV